MTKIKVISKEEEIEGTVEQKNVTPFGTSAHIVVPKKHTGKVVKIVIPNEPQYSWILTDGEKKEMIKVCTRIAKHKNGKLVKYKLEAIENIKTIRFDLDDLLKVIEMLKKSKNHKHLVIKLKTLYNLE